MLDKIYKYLFRLFILYLLTINSICFITTFNPKALINPFYIKNRTISVYLLAKHIILESGIPTKIKQIEKTNKLIKKISKRYDIDDKLIMAVVKVESKYNPFAISRTGAMGLMQLMPITFFEMGFEDPFNIEENLEAGIKYLSIQLKRFKKLELALSAYNAGPSNVKSEIPKIFETKHYIKKILKEYENLKKISSH